MSLVLATSVVVTAPASTDGRGEVATLNDSTSGTYVGRVFKATGFGGAAVRTSMDNIPEGHGATFGNFYYAHRPFTLEVALSRAATWALSDARYNKLCRAFDAMADDGTIVFTDTDSVVKRVLFRREQSPTDPDEQGHVLLGGVCEDPRIYANVATGPSTSSPQTNAGNANTPPTFTFTPSGNGTVILTNSTTSEALTLTVGTGYLATGAAVTVDFGAKTISQSGAFVPQAEVFPTSTWWELIPGSNAWTRTGTATISTAAAITFRSAWLSA